MSSIRHSRKFKKEKCKKSSSNGKISDVFRPDRDRDDKIEKQRHFSIRIKTGKNDQKRKSCCRSAHQRNLLPEQKGKRQPHDPTARSRHKIKLRKSLRPENRKQFAAHEINNEHISQNMQERAVQKCIGDNRPKKTVTDRDRRKRKKPSEKIWIVEPVPKNYLKNKNTDRAQYNPLENLRLLRTIIIPHIWSIINHRLKKLGYAPAETFASRAAERPSHSFHRPRQPSPATDRPNHPAWISRRKNIRRNRPGDNTSRSDHRTRADGYARTKNRAAANPNVIANRNRFCKFETSPPDFRIKRMGRRVDLHGRTKKHVIPNFDLHDIENHAVEIEINLFAERNIGPVIAKKRRLNPNIAFITKKFR